MQKNNTNFDPFKIIAEMADHFAKSGKIVDEIYIKKLIKNWKIKDFHITEDGRIENKYAVEEIKKQLEKLYSVIPENTTFATIQMNQVQIEHTDKHSGCGYTLFLCMFCTAIFCYYSHKMNKPNTEQYVLMKLTNTVIDNINGCLTAYMSGDYITVIQKLRMIYESNIIFLFVNKHKETIPLFLEHIKIIENNIYQDFPDYKPHQQENLNLDFETVKNDMYCWTKEIFPERKDRKLIKLAEDVGSENKMNTIYKLSSNFIHTNAFTAFINEKTTRDFANASLPMISLLLTRQVVAFIKAVNPTQWEIDLITTLLHNLEIQFFPDLFEDEIEKYETKGFPT